MPAPSTLLSLTVLSLVLTSVVAFAFIVYSARSAWVETVIARIKASREAVSAEDWFSGNVIVLKITNVGSEPVSILSRSIIYTYRYGNEFDSDVIILGPVSLRPAQSLFNEIVAPIPPNSTITDVSVVISTTRGVYTYQTVPTMTELVIPIRKRDIGAMYTINVGNYTIRFNVTEVLFCSVGQDRVSTALENPDVSAVAMATSQYEVQTRLMVYGDDVDADVTINSTSTPQGLLTTCSVSASRDVTGRVVLGRAVVLVSTDLGPYDVMAALMPSGLHPTTNDTGFFPVTFINKFGLPLNTTDPMSYISSQLIASVTQRPEGYDEFVVVGTYPSGAIVVGEAVASLSDVSGSEIEVSAVFPDPYPVILVLSPPPAS